MRFMHGWNKQGVPVSIALPYIYFTQVRVRAVWTVGRAV